MPPRRRSRGHIRTLPSGNFQAIVYAGTDPLTGKERYLRETAATYAGAERALTRLQTQVDEERHPKTAITVRQAITQWLDVAELQDTTRERYDDLIRLYILPTLDGMLASKLDAELHRAAGALLRPATPLPRAVHGTTPGRTCLPAAEHQHHLLSSRHQCTTRLDLGRGLVRSSADRAGTHLPLIRPDVSPREGPRSSRVVHWCTHHWRPRSFKRIEIVIYDKESDRQRALNLKSPTIRDAVAKVTTHEHLRSLFNLAGS